MKFRHISSQEALNRFVELHIDRFMEFHARTTCTLHVDRHTGEEYLSIFDPETDQCLTLWYTPALFGSRSLKEAKVAIASILEGGVHGT